MIGEMSFIKKKNYTDAFTVFADAYYRHSDNKDFLNNTFVMLYNSLNVNWQEKNWLDSKRLVEETIDLDILQPKDRNHIEALLINWSRYFNSLFDEKSANEVKQLINKLKDV